ncbi:MAG TPA: hypothetical protein VFZ66_26785 [Herpetosiphonaceae bacterium]
MPRRFWLSLAVALSLLLTSLIPAQAAPQRVFYSGLQSCYVTGSTIPNFTLTAEVATTDEYRMTHTVAQSGGPPGVPETVYEGPIAADSPRTVTITGGNATVPGSYTITGRLYLVSSGVLLAQVQASVLIADPCPTPTPDPPDTIAAPADVLWSEAALPSRGATPGAIVTVSVRAFNAGRGAGASSARLSYDPAVLDVLDAQPQRADDWIRARDDRGGTLTIAVGALRPQEQTVVPIRFRVAGAAPTTTLRLVRDDGLDLGNPLFLTIGRRLDGPLELQAERHGTVLGVTGRGFKPGEVLSVWGNRADGSAVALGGGRTHDDRDGTITLNVQAPAAGVTSIVVVGRISGVTGLLDLRSAAQDGVKPRTAHRPLR